MAVFDDTLPATRRCRAAIRAELVRWESTQKLVATQSWIWSASIVLTNIAERLLISPASGKP